MHPHSRSAPEASEDELDAVGDLDYDLLQAPGYAQVSIVNSVGGVQLRSSGSQGSGSSGIQPLDSLGSFEAPGVSYSALHASRSAVTTGQPGAREQGGKAGKVSEASQLEARRQSRLLEKNRRAQARFRNKQKDKLKDYERQIEELSNQVEKLMQEKAELADQKSTLETKYTWMTKVIDIRAQQESLSKSDDVRVQNEKVVEAIGAFARTLHNNKVYDEDAVKKLTTVDFLQMYKEFIGALADCLLNGGHEAGSPQNSRLVELIAAGRQVGQRMSIAKPDLAISVASKAHEDPFDKYGVPNDALWRKVLHVVEFTDAQKARLLELRQHLFQAMDGIIARRRATVQDLQSVLAVGPGAGPGPLSGHRMFVKACQASEKLKESLLEEHATVMQFLLSVSEQTMTPVQEARAMVESYPYHLDTLAIINLIAEERGGGPGATPDADLGGLFAEMVDGGLMDGEHGALIPMDSAFRALTNRYGYTATPPQQGPASIGPSGPTEQGGSSAAGMPSQLGQDFEFPMPPNDLLLFDALLPTTNYNFPPSP